MPKGKKRRKLNVGNSLNLLSNLTGFDDASTVTDSLDDCMELFKMQQSSSNVVVSPQTETTNGPVSTSIVEKRPIWKMQKDKSAEKIEAWNRTFLSWTHGGKYTPGLLPNIDEELTRNFKVKELSSLLLKSGGDIRMPVFERWLLDSKLEETINNKMKGPSDPVLPVKTTPKSEASIRLIQELCQYQDESQAEKIVAELCRNTNLKCQQLLSGADRYRRQSPLNRGDRIEIERQESDAISILYSRKKWKKPFCFKLNKEHYHKLCNRFFEIHNNGRRVTTKLDRKNQKVMHALNIIVLTLLLRYSALSGGQLLQDLRGGGMQGAIHKQVFEVLESTLDGPWLEGFASPFNACLPVFGSAFPDLEWHFGSIGSFMEVPFHQGGGCCEANPPFSPGVMNQMSKHIINQIEKAEKNNVELTFVIVVPTANGPQDSAAVKQSASHSFERLVKSSYCRRHIIFLARKHGYLEGAQHLRPTRYKESAYDTSVIFLQSQSACLAEAIDLEKFENDLRDAFASRHGVELAERREGKKG